MGGKVAVTEVSFGIGAARLFAGKNAPKKVEALLEEQAQMALFRHGILKEIERKLGGSVLAYVESPAGENVELCREDAGAFEELVRGMDKTKKLFIILNTGGGDPDAAEKIVNVFRNEFKAGVEVIIPDYAKSAGTLISIGADKIIMGPAAELGPVDPQIFVTSPKHPEDAMFFSARKELDTLEHIERKLKKDPELLGLYEHMLSKMSLELYGECLAGVKYFTALAERLLGEGAMAGKSGGEISKTVKVLIGYTEYSLHSGVISGKTARDKLGMNVEIMRSDDEAWNLIMDYYKNATGGMEYSGVEKVIEGTEVSKVLIGDSYLDIVQKRSRRKADKPESGHAESGAEVALVKARR